MLCTFAMMVSCSNLVMVDYAGYCDMYVANASGHTVEFETYDELGRDPQTTVIPDGGKVKVRSYYDMGSAPVNPQRIFLDTVVFRFDDGTNLTHTGTIYEVEYYHRVIKPFYPDSNNVLDLASWAVTRTHKSEHCPLEIGVFTLTESDYATALQQQTAALP